MLIILRKHTFLLLFLGVSLFAANISEQAHFLGLTFWFEGLTEPQTASFFNLSVIDSSVVQSQRFKTISDYGSWVEGKWQSSNCEKVTVYWESDEPFSECVTERGRGEYFHHGNSFTDIRSLIDVELFAYDVQGYTGYSFIPNNLWCTIDYIGEVECFAFLSQESDHEIDNFKHFMTRNKALVTNIPPAEKIEITQDPFTANFPLDLDSLWSAAKLDTFIVWRRSKPTRHIIDLENDGRAEVMYITDNQSAVSIYRMGEKGPRKVFETKWNLFVQPIALLDVTGDGLKELFLYVITDEGTKHNLHVYSQENDLYCETASFVMFKTP